MPTLRGRIEHVRDVLQEAAAHRFVPGGIAYLHGIAQLEADHTVHITTPDGLAREVAARAVLVATGSRPTHYPGIAFDDPDVYDSDEIYSLRTVPKTSSYGPISVEFATVFTALGIRAKLVSNTDRLLPNIDGELAGLVADEFQRRRVRLVLGASADGVRRVDGRLRVTLSTGTGLDADAVLVAAGRTPNTEGLGSNRPAYASTPAAGSSSTATTGRPLRGSTRPATWSNQRSPPTPCSKEAQRRPTRADSSSVWRSIRPRAARYTAYPKSPASGRPKNRSGPPVSPTPWAAATWPLPRAGRSPDMVDC
jgi:Pyridine nucleotide-disulphide oxidoreductase